MTPGVQRPMRPVGEMGEMMDQDRGEGRREEWVEDQGQQRRLVVEMRREEVQVAQGEDHPVGQEGGHRTLCPPRQFPQRPPVRGSPPRSTLGMMGRLSVVPMVVFRMQGNSRGRSGQMSSLGRRVTTRLWGE
jgi:hypothetical protein